MGFFTRIRPAEQQEKAAPAGSKIVLNFGSRAAQAAAARAAATLDAGGYVEPLPREPEPGDRMPDGTIYAGVSPATAKPMYVTPADAPLTMTFDDAVSYAEKLDAHGHQDWRLPSAAELNVLFNNRAAIGGINASFSGPAGWYWSGTKEDTWTAWGQRFSDGSHYYDDKGLHSLVRCVR